MTLPSAQTDKPKTTLPYTIAKALIIIMAPFFLVASGYIGFMAMFSSCYAHPDCNDLLRGGVYTFPVITFGVLAWAYYEVRRRSQLVRRENMRRTVSQELGRPSNPFEMDQTVLEILQTRGPLAQRDVMELAGIKEEDVLAASTKRLLDQQLIRQRLIDQQVILSLVSDEPSSPSGFGHR